MKISKSNSNELKLNIGKILPQSRVNGPGNRCVVWLQGCGIRCPHCMNQQFLSREPKTVMTVSELYETIASMPDIEGVTYSGGEPFEQAKGLYYLGRKLKGKGLTVMSYSGYTYRELISRKDRYISGLLSTLDILVDGRFEADKAASLPWRGSRNQKVHFLTEKYKHCEKDIDREGVDMEFSLMGSDVTVTGNFHGDLLQKITTRLKNDYGIILK